MIIKGKITIGDVGSALNEQSRILRVLCKSAKANMWAKYKAVDSPKKSKLKDADYANANYGIDAYGCTANSAAAVLNLYNQKGGQWNRILPGTRFKVYRLGDFNGYNTEAECPIALDIAIEPEEKTHVSPAWIVTTVRLSPNGEIPLEQISTDFDMTLADLCFIYHRRTGPLQNVWSGIDTGLSFADLKAQGMGSSAEARFNLPATVTPTEWEGLWVFCEDVGLLVGDGDEAALFVPESLQQWTVQLTSWVVSFGSLATFTQPLSYEFDPTYRGNSHLYLEGNSLRAYIDGSEIPDDSVSRNVTAHIVVSYFNGSTKLFSDEVDVPLQGLLPKEQDDPDSYYYFQISDEHGTIQLSSIYNTPVTRVEVSGELRAVSPSIELIGDYQIRTVSISI